MKLRIEIPDDDANAIFKGRINKNFANKKEYVASFISNTLAEQIRLCDLRAETEEAAARAAEKAAARAGKLKVEIDV